MDITRDTLYMKYPSAWWHDLWREGLACGNGIIGSNTYGGVKKETTMLTHHDLWHGKQCEELPDVSDAFIELRKKMDEGKFQEANGILVRELEEKGYKAKLESCLPLCDLSITYRNGQGFSDYLRWIHMDTGESGCKWTDKGSHYQSLTFVSRADNMIVKRISSTTKSLDMQLSLDMHLNEGSNVDKNIYQHILDSKETNVELPFIVYSACNDDGQYYGAVVRVCQGTLMEKGKAIDITESQEVIIFVKIFVKVAEKEKENEITKLKQELLACKNDYNFYLERHKVLHEALYKSAVFELDYGKPHSNEELLLEAFEGRQNPELIEKLWKFGRYLFISGSNESSNPFPLYGLWGGEYDLLWCHNMANINMQMLYWHSFAGNLIDYNKSFFKYYNDRMETFKNNAKMLFGMKGIYITAGTTPGMAAPNQIVPVIMNWVSAAGWLAQHYYLYYQYTNDKDYLKETILPFMEEVAAFYECYLAYYPDGSIKFYPSISPENTPQNFMPPEGIQIPHPMPTTINSTIDLAILKEFFSNMCALAKEENLYIDKIQQWNKILRAIPEYRVSEDGGIREWQDERFDERYAHRHLSHVYPVFPGHEVNNLHNKELLPAFKKAVELREIGEQTGWSMAYMAGLYARLEESEKAMECLDNMTKSSLISNFFTLHNDWRGMNISLGWDPSPVQLDACLGYVNAIQEMLVFSSKDLLKLLPALPKCMKKGRVESFRYINGTINMSWDLENNKFDCFITAIRKHKLIIQLLGGETKFEIQRNRADAKWEENLLVAEFDANGMIQFKLL